MIDPKSHFSSSLGTHPRIPSAQLWTPAQFQPLVFGVSNFDCSNSTCVCASSRSWVELLTGLDHLDQWRRSQARFVGDPCELAPGRRDPSYSSAPFNLPLPQLSFLYFVAVVASQLILDEITSKCFFQLRKRLCVFDQPFSALLIGRWFLEAPKLAQYCLFSIEMITCLGVIGREVMSLAQWIMTNLTQNLKNLLHDKILSQLSTFLSLATVGYPGIVPTSVILSNLRSSFQVVMNYGLVMAVSVQKWLVTVLQSLMLDVVIRMSLNFSVGVAMNEHEQRWCFGTSSPFTKGCC